MEIEIANFAGLTQAGWPVKMSGSTSIPTSVPASVMSMSTPAKMSGRLKAQARRRSVRGSGTPIPGMGDASVFIRLLLSPKLAVSVSDHSAPLPYSWSFFYPQYPS